MWLGLFFALAAKKCGLSSYLIEHLGRDSTTSPFLFFFFGFLGALIRFGESCFFDFFTPFAFPYSFFLTDLAGLRVKVY